MIDLNAWDWYRREHPEIECAEAGDPFLGRIVRFDEHIVEYQVNRDWYDIPDLEADMIVTTAQHAQLAYELAVLTRWWRLHKPRPP